MADEALLLGRVASRQRQGAFAVTGGADQFDLGPALSYCERFVAWPVSIVQRYILPLPFASAVCQYTKQQNNTRHQDRIPSAQLHSNAPVAVRLMLISNSD
jgi:hypothetical protein